MALDSRVVVVVRTPEGKELGVWEGIDGTGDTGPDLRHHLVIGEGNTLYSASHPFTPADVNNCLFLFNRPGFVMGYFGIIRVEDGRAYCETAYGPLGEVGSRDGICRMGGPLRHLK